MKKLLVIILILIIQTGNSQESDDRFNLILSGGLVGGQIDGDEYSGYNKLGPFAGIFLNKKLSEKVLVDFGLTYIQKGVRKNPTIDNPYFYIARYNYAEVPLIFSGYYKSKFRVEGGLSFAYLFNKHEENSSVGLITLPIKSYDFCMHLGGGYKLTDKLYTNIRFGYSLIPIRTYLPGVYVPGWNRVFNKGLYNNTLGISLNYIIQPKEKTSE